GRTARCWSASCATVAARYRPQGERSFPMRVALTLRSGYADRLGVDSRHPGAVSRALHSLFRAPQFTASLLHPVAAGLIEVARTSACSYALCCRRVAAKTAPTRASARADRRVFQL